MRTFWKGLNWWAGILVALCRVGGVQATEPSLDQEEQAVPLFPSARAQLEYARGLKLLRRGASLELRAYWGQQAVEAYRSVRARFPLEHALVAEAQFRAGRLLVLMGQEETALHDFFLIVEQSSEFGLRARMEIAHVHRRREQWRRALEHYSRVANDPKAGAKWRANARMFVGDMCMNLGRIAAAKQAWLVVANGHCDMRKRVLAFDRLARLEIKVSNHAATAELFLACLSSLGEVVLEDSKEGRRVRRALQRSRLVGALAERKKNVLKGPR